MGSVSAKPADEPAVVNGVLGQMRLDLAEKFGLIDENENRLVWIVDWPMMEWNEDEKRWAANRFKSFVRNFVNSESFSIAVDGLANQDSAFWNVGLKFKNLIHRKPKDGDLQPLAETACTIQ